MTKYKIYLDSNVFISCVREEIDGQLNLRFSDAEKFFALCAKRSMVVVLSDAFFAEVKHITGLQAEDVIETMREIGIKIKLVQRSKNSEEIARRIMRQTGIHFSDAKHIALALESGCNVVVSWNKKDFEKAHTYIPCITPEDFV